MPTLRERLLPKFTLSFVMLAAFLTVLWLAGGASRADVLGQTVVRATGWLMLIIAVLFQRFRSIEAVRPAAIILAAAIVLALVQLIPLPPAVWQALPGRHVFEGAAMASAQPQPARPWSLVPGATLNAAGSLVVPLTVIVLAAGMDTAERSRLIWLLLALMLASAMIGLLQFSGAELNNPFINDTPGQISSSFANRNHFALFLAIGCAMLPVWTFAGDRRASWRAPVAIGVLLLFVLVILATGSRAGMLVTLLAIALGLLMVKGRIQRELRGAPRWVFPVLIALIVLLFVGFVLISVAASRAASISRIIAMDPGQDMRGRALPTVLDMVWTYFPAGAGLGSFDPIFRMHEPFNLLKATYFNHAHNDFIEVVLDAGLPGLLVLTGALGWWLIAAVRVWRAAPEVARMQRLGATVVSLVIVASIVDYPARTPMVMAIVALAAIWLNDAEASAPSSALRSRTRHL